MSRHTCITMLCIVSIGLWSCEEGPPRDVAEQVDRVEPAAVDIAFEEMADESVYVNGSRGQESIRRLTRAQFERSVKTLLGDDIVVPTVAEPDVARGGLRAVGASALTYTARGVESVETVAYAVADQALSNDSKRQVVVGCELGGDQAPNCAEDAIGRWATRAWRRPVTAQEQSALMSVYTGALETLGNPVEALKFPMAAILQSPHFLFRVEVAHGVSGDEEKSLPAHELAARLSYFLWNTPPDELLLAAVSDGRLETRRGLFDQAKRMLADARARDGIRSLFDDHLKLYELDHMSKDPTVFEHFNDKLGAYAREETLRLIDDLVFAEPRDFRELMTSTVTFINPMLASIYEMPAPKPNAFGRATIPESKGRVGILGHVSFLATHAHSRASSATRRGLAVRTILLCQNIPPAPVDVDTSIPEPSAADRTLRERVAKHLESPSCAGCHRLTDPIGLGLENFDGIGRHRTTEYDTVIDPSGELDGTYFSDAVELGTAIKEHPAFVPCVVKVVSRYAVGRMEDAVEREWIDTLTDRFAYHNYQLRPLMLELIVSPLFRRVGLLRTAR
ncbi:MAG: DUF1592 domain-containing protein [Myxococcota bacterium]|nr:DUF1592 domain-containing protein [Myxococcota bacterium]